LIAMLVHAGGATLAEIIAETGWQKHMVHGFISTLASKNGFVVTSAGREADMVRVSAVA
jgi:hypothetical protein